MVSVSSNWSIGAFAHEVPNSVPEQEFSVRACFLAFCDWYISLRECTIPIADCSHSPFSSFCCSHHFVNECRWRQQLLQTFPSIFFNEYINGTGRQIWESKFGWRPSDCAENGIFSFSQQPKQNYYHDDNDENNENDDDHRILVTPCWRDKEKTNNELWIQQVYSLIQWKLKDFESR